MAVEDVTHLLDKEEGTAWDPQTLMFAEFGDGSVFNYDAARIRDFDHMLDRDGKARTLEQVLTLPIQSAPQSIVRAGSKKHVADKVEQWFFAPANNGGMSTSMNTVVSQMSAAIVNTKAFFEKVLTERDGDIVYDKVAWRPPQTCVLKRDPKTAAFEGFKQMPITEGQTEDVWIPAARAFVYIHGTKRNPLEGVSDLNIAYWCYQTKQKIRFLWYQFLETQSLPKTVVKAPDTTTAREAARDIARLRQSGVVGIQNTIDVEPFEASGRGAAQFKEALDWLNAEASGSVLAAFTDLGATAAGGTGSFALSKDQTDFFLMSRQAVAKEMEDTLNQYLIPDLVRYNFGPGTKSPMFKFGPIAEDDAAAAIALLQATAQTPIEQSVIPREFFNELIEQVAAYLGLNTQVVRDGLERAADEAEGQATAVESNPEAPKVARVAGAVNAATNAVVRRIGETANVPDSTPAQPRPHLRDVSR